MTTHLDAAPHLAPATTAEVAVSPVAKCPIAAAVKARAKALKKWRKHERTRIFFGWCAGCHALGFSF